MRTLAGACLTLALLGGLALSATNAAISAPNEVVGRASVIDGDTIEIGGKRIRFFGIDAPEGAQQCRDAGGKAYRCGQRAALALDEMVQGKTVHCDQRDIDRYRRIVAVCTANGVDLNAALVEAGLAVAYRSFSRMYVANEESAKRGRRGLWAGTFEMPWDYRPNRRRR
jgi:endonuclease YncB( thermonuclease family)